MHILALIFVREHHIQIICAYLHTSPSLQQGALSQTEQKLG